MLLGALLHISSQNLSQGCGLSNRDTVESTHLCMFVFEVYLTLHCNKELSSIPGPTRHKLFIHKEAVEICIDWIDLTSQL